MLYDPDQNRRGIGHLDLGSRRLTQVIGGRELFGWLLQPIGADHAGNVYAVQDSRVAQISPDGDLDVIATFDALVTAPGGQLLFTSVVNPDEPSVLVVEVYDRTGARIARHRLALPASGHPYDPQWRLVRADHGQQYDVFGGERPGHLGTAYACRGHGAPILMDPAADVLSRGSRLQRPGTWQVGTDGRVYLPVLAAEGVTVARLSSVAAGGRPQTMR